MNDTAFQEDPRLDRLEEAADWLQRMRAETPDASVMEACVEWCQSDPQNQKAFDEMVSLWELSGQLPGTALPSRATVAARPAVPATRRWALAASIAVLGFVAWGAVSLTNRQAAPDVVTIAYSSPIGQNTRHALADGSMLELGGGTRALVSMGSERREVQLEAGELFVTVKHDDARPFAVAAGRLAVIATGTAFNVLRTDERTTVTVTEGSVAASYEGQSATVPDVHLQTSQQLVYSHGSHTVVVRQSDPDQVLAWRQGTLRFQNERLSDVIATVNRYAPAAIVIDDAGVRALAFTGTARIDRIDGWLAGLPLVFPVEIAPLADGRQLIRPRPGARAD